MFKSISFTALLSVISFSGMFAQTMIMPWAFGLGSQYDEDVHSMSVAPNGDVLIVGGFFNTIDFDLSAGTNVQTSNGGQDMYIARYDHDGNLVWVKHIGSTNEDFARFVKADTNGDIYVTGHFYGTVDFNPDGAGDVRVSNGGADMFVMKLDQDGNFIWVSTFGGSSTDMGFAVAADPSGNVYCAGAFMSSVDFDNSANVDMRYATDRDIFLVKLDVNGNSQWAYTAGGSDWDYAGAVILKGQDVFVSGAFRNQVRFDGNDNSTIISSAGNVDSFLVKLQDDGSFQWVKTIGGGLDDYAFFTDDPTGNLACGGWFKGTCDFDTSPASYTLTSNGNADAIIGKYDVNGNLIWAKNIGGTSNDYGQGVNVDGNGNIYISGLYEGTADYDPGPGTSMISSNGMQDIFACKYTGVGSFVWSYSTGSTANDYAYTCASSPGGEVYVGGWVGSSLDFDPSANVNYYQHVGGHDIAVFKLDTDCPVISTTQTFELCPGDTITVGNSTYTQAGVYEDKFVAVNGCDSIVVTILAYTQINTDIEQNGNVLSALTAGATYQWLDCNDNMNPVAGATMQDYEFSNDNSLAIEITLSGCVDTSDCISVVGEGVQMISFGAIIVFPNPSADVFNIRLTENCDIRIFDNQGKLIYQSLHSPGNSMIEAENWASGIYYLNYKAEKSEGSVTIVKE
ncbi:MAG: T9SS type A sorting domain-containing protein [Flavobacteriales bacterium]|nr:T9SS type A sorting domain-containing protein [Flavobacteriales bacterium]